MATLIHDTTVVSGDVAETVHHEAAILIEGDRVAAVGSSAEIVARHPTAERIDGAGAPSSRASPTPTPTCR